MPVFDGKIKTPLRVEDPLTDRSLPAAGVLSWAGRRTVSGLAGCTGVDARLVHGDVWEQIDANITTIIDQNEAHNVKQNRDTLVVLKDTLILGDLDETVRRTSSYHHVGAEISTNVGATIHNYVQPLTENHLSPRNIHEPTNTIECFGDVFTIQGANKTLVGTQIQGVGMSIGAIGVQAQGIGAQVQQMGVFNLQMALVNVGVNGLNTSVNIGYIKNAPAYIWTGVSLGTNEWM
jgi:hypothetical protein